MHAARSNPFTAELGLTLPEQDRRRRPRHKPCASGYAVGDTVVSGRVAELNEILDISEEGMGIQALWPLPVGRTVDFRLDLPKPSTYAETKGTVIWCEPSGRAGVHFERISESNRSELRAWLLANAINHGANPGRQPVDQNPLDQNEDMLVCEIAAVKETKGSHNTDYTSMLAALAAVKREVESLGSDREAALQLIASRAQVFTRAAGVAIALSEGSQMTCRATSGRDTPPVGARLEIGAGFSGKCVRTGALLRCTDTETDPLVDRESCRAMGIRSMVAVPIRLSNQVIGLLEVFSPEPSNFAPDDEIVLQRLALVVSEMMQGRPSRAFAAASPANNIVDDEFPIETAADLPLPRLSYSQNGLLISAGVTVIVAVLWLIGTWDGHQVVASHSTVSQPQSQSRTQTVPSLTTPASTNVSTNDLEGLRRLAEQGDSTAQFALGARYATGQDVPQDYTEAMRWFTQASEQGNVIAQSALAAYYWSGRGGTVDPDKAYFWSLVAQAGGDDTSKSIMPVLETRLSRRDMEAARQRATEWLKQHPVARKDAAPAPTP
jgi:putative methionine-R-sulfoxide reductase with GAF domain